MLTKSQIMEMLKLLSDVELEKLLRFAKMLLSEEQEKSND